MNFDLIVSEARVVDGANSSQYIADIGIIGDQITAVGDLRGADTQSRIESRGLVVCPGFVDTHAHVENALLCDGAVEAKLSQGVTTEILGQDGLSYAPLPSGPLREQVDYLTALNGHYKGQGATFSEFLDQYAGRVAQNVASLAPYGAIRLAVAGWADRALTDEEIREACKLSASCLEEGAVGIGLGLDYFPQSVASTAELMELGKIAARYDSILVAHTRMMELGVVASVQELVDIGAATGARVHVSHLRVEAALPVVDQALVDGVDVSFDVYPYTRASTMLTMILPTWALAGGPALLRARLVSESDRADIAAHIERVLAPVSHDYVLSNVGLGRYAEFVGSSLSDAAEAIGEGFGEAMIKLVLANDLHVGYVGGTQTEASVAACMSHPAAMAGSDAILVGQLPHPRGWGTFPRFIKTSVQDTGAMTLEACVHKLTGKPAARFGLTGRGVVQPGMAADLVVFDPADIADQATYEQPRQPSTGIKVVIINGEVAWHGTSTSRRPGSILRRG